MYSRFAVLFLLALALPAAADDQKAVDPVRKREAEKRFAKLKEYLAERRVSHVVELLAEWGEFADVNQQDDVLGWVADLREAEKGIAATLGKQTFQIGYRGVKATSEVVQREFPSAFFVDEFSRVQVKQGRMVDGVRRQLVVASKTLVARPNTSACQCVILTNAAVAEFHGLDDCLVISSGSVRVTNNISGSAVICRGDAEYIFNPSPYQGYVWAGGSITDVYPGLARPRKLEEGAGVERDERLQGMKFYSAAEDGVTAAAWRGCVCVQKVDAGKAFGKAGVRAGDVIVSVNGEKVETRHALDRVVCRATVAGGTAAVKVRRDWRDETVEVKLFDWAAYTPTEKKADPKAPAPDKK